MAIASQVKLALAAAAANNIAASQSPGAGTITLNGSVGTGNLDTARRIAIASGGNDSGITFTVTGTNRGGNALSETITGGNIATVYTTQDFLSVSSVTHTGSIAGTVEVGTNQVASSMWLLVDRDVNPTNIGLGVVISGTINYSVEYTFDDPNAPFTGTFPTVFSDLTPTALVNATATKDAAWPAGLTVFAIRLTQNSFTSPATAAMIMLQSVLTPT